MRNLDKINKFAENYRLDKPRVVVEGFNNSNFELLTLARFCERKRREYTNKLATCREGKTKCNCSNWTLLRKIYGTEAYKLRKEYKRGQLAK